ncbi:MAG: histidine kinase [Burkholderiaceae bacterium]|nr:histidine kinase [Burkholderiaceae bacterium]
MNNFRTATDRDYWFCQLVGWGTLAVFSVLSSSFGDWQSTLRFAAAKLFCTATGLGLSHLWRGQLRRRGWLVRQRGFPFGRIGAWLLLLAVVQTGFLLWSDQLFRGGALFDDSAAGLAFNIVLLLLIWFVLFLIWTLCYAVALSRRRATQFELEKLQLEVSVKEAELRALQSQVNPHFFFNSLNSIRALVYQDADAAARAINRLAGMMRHSLQAGHADRVRLADDMAAVRAYLDMERLRFRERLQFSEDIAPALGDTLLPPMVLQTLVENAIRHGVERATGPCQVSISAERTANAVLVRVTNQGTLAADSDSTRVGLANARQRLALQFGPAASCTLAQSPGWVTATITLPQEAA